MSITTHRISVGGVPQAYHVAGSGPVCVAHSGGPGIDWAYLRMPLLEQRFTMVYLEPVGTGDSGRLPAYPLSAYAEFVAAVVDHLGSPSVYVLGHSHGGFVMQQFALDHPSRVAGIVLYDTSPVTGAAFWDSATAGVMAYGAVDPAVPAAFEQAVTATDDDALSVALRQAVPVYFADFPGRRDEFAPFVAGVRAWAVPQDPEPFDVRARLGEISAPTVIIVGEHDFICGPRWAAMLHAGIPGSRLVTLRSSGHFGHVEQPVPFAEAVSALLG
ncbi:hydrolase [Actinoplanes cyaneus]|uniref:Hydrolase n=1 Tax=Actinoplanes cyaneus TaxID=52696 RepID=A0A919ISB8_9ACTN|nr:alpha/beta hydrolase [Actinoplanes cyaneus]MCW2143008.1 proline iminopeptidase [Actinoplanes cyaneus]GID69557.1 hydrolase [Actinoplanes cyaneus]